MFDIPTVGWGFRPYVDTPPVGAIIQVGRCAGCGYLTMTPHSVCPMMIRFVTKPHQMIVGWMTMKQILTTQARWN